MDPVDCRTVEDCPVRVVLVGVSQVGEVPGVVAGAGVTQTTTLHLLALLLTVVPHPVVVGLSPVLPAAHVPLEGAVSALRLVLTIATVLPHVTNQATNIQLIIEIFTSECT